jgi:hypothetical protein
MLNFKPGGHLRIRQQFCKRSGFPLEAMAKNRVRSRQSVQSLAKSVSFLIKHYDCFKLGILQGFLALHKYPSISKYNQADFCFSGLINFPILALLGHKQP